MGWFWKILEDIYIYMIGKYILEDIGRYWKGVCADHGRSANQRRWWDQGPPRWSLTQNSAAPNAKSQLAFSISLRRWWRESLLPKFKSRMFFRWCFSMVFPNYKMPKTTISQGVFHVWSWKSRSQGRVPADVIPAEDIPSARVVHLKGFANELGMYYDEVRWISSSPGDPGLCQRWRVKYVGYTWEIHIGYIWYR